MIAYHDQEWGVPVHDDRLLFEMLTLEGAQAGLSWSTVLKKREGYRAAFASFDPIVVSQMTLDDVERLMLDPGIIRNRAKILSTIGNAKLVLEIQKEFGSFDRYLWESIGGQTVGRRPTGMGDIPAKTALSDELSKRLLKRGFKFVGSTICYAFMQATGMVNDHVVRCRCNAVIKSAEFG
jgi:DNA-3-methyladenine glycosylase I